MSEKLARTLNEWKAVVAVILVAGAFYGFESRRSDDQDAKLKEHEQKIDRLEDVYIRMDNNITEIKTDNKHILKAIDEIKKDK